MKLVAILLTTALSLGSAFAPAIHINGASNSAPRPSLRSAIMMKQGSQVAYRIRRKRIQNQARGRMRLNVFRSNNHIYAQVIDDVEGHTLAACSTLDSTVKSQIKTGSTIPAASAVGSRLAEILKEKGIDSVYFDRFSGSHKYLYHGRVKALVDSVREGGVKI